MYLSDAVSEEILEKLIKEIQITYAIAWSGVSTEASDYFASYKRRWAKEYAAYQSGKYTKEQFEEWELAQLGRGRRWEELRDDLARRMVNANEVASAYINDATPGVYSINANYEAFLIEQSQPHIDFKLVDEATVRQLILGQTRIIPQTRVGVAQSLLWHEKQLTQALTSAILQGRGIDYIANEFQKIANMDRVSAIRNARTSVTTAQNSGRQYTYQQATEMGIKMRKEWIATIDARTRDSHAELDGVRIDVGGTYPNGLRFPGDQSGRPEEFYNCRCTERAIIEDINGEIRLSKIDGHMGAHNERTYKEWADRKREEKMRKSKPTTHADATHRAQENKDG